MQLGMIGLGRMGGNMTIRLQEHGHDMKTFDRSSETRTAKSLEELRDQLDVPRAFWMMIPAGAASCFLSAPSVFAVDSTRGSYVFTSCPCCSRRFVIPPPIRPSPIIPSCIRS